VPLIPNDKPKSPMTAWWQASWMIGLVAWLLLFQLFIFRSADMLSHGIVQLLLVAGAGLSALDGVPYVRGGEPHHALRRRNPDRETLHVVTDDGEHGVVVMNHIAPPKGGGGGEKKAHPLHLIFYVAPRIVGDALLTLAWKGIGKALGRDERRVGTGTKSDTPTGEIHRRGPQTVVERREPRYRLFRP